MKKIIFSIAFILVILSSMFSINAFAAEMADGTYEVNIALWNSEDDKESMAADAIGKKATIVVENGVKTMHITSGEMSMMGIKASLQELRISDRNGNFTDAKVESRNSEGNPTGFYFTMPHTDKYITVKVNPHIAIMGNKDIGARIKVDYSTLKLISSFETETVTAVSTEPETTIVTVTQTDGERVTQIITVTESTVVEISETTTELFEQTSDTEILSETTETTVQSEYSDKNYTSVITLTLIVILLIVLVILKIKKKK